MNRAKFLSHDCGIGMTPESFSLHHPEYETWVRPKAPLCNRERRKFVIKGEAQRAT
jgi:hypothetical protein